MTARPTDIDLDPAAYVAKGNGSLVFDHPDDPHTLLKVPRERTPKKLRRRLSAALRPDKRRFGKYREWHREYEEYIAAIRKAGALPHCLPVPRGFVQTSIGPAFAVEKITDEGSNDMALTVKDYLATHDPEPLRAPLARFFEDVARYRLVFFDLKLHNQCVVRDASGVPVRVVSIDSIGESTLFKFRRWSTTAHSYWLNRERRAFMEKVFDAQ